MWQHPQPARIKSKRSRPTGCQLLEYFSTLRFSSSFGLQQVSFYTFFLSRILIVSCRRLSLIPQASQHFTHTDMPASSTHWAVVATPPSMSMPHIDAGKFCTEVETIRGAKLWFIRDTDVTPTVNALSAMDPTDHQWVGLVLPADHRL